MLKNRITEVEQLKYVTSFILQGPEPLCIVNLPFVRPML